MTMFYQWQMAAFPIVIFYLYYCMYVVNGQWTIFHQSSPTFLITKCVVAHCIIFCYTELEIHFLMMIKSRNICVYSLNGMKMVGLVVHGCVSCTLFCLFPLRSLFPIPEWNYLLGWFASTFANINFVWFAKIQIKICFIFVQNGEWDSCCYVPAYNDRIFSKRN